MTANLDELPLLVTGLLVWAVSMGWHGLTRAILKDVGTKVG